MTKSVTTGDQPPDSMTAMDPNAAEQQKFVSRKDKRKALKKNKRKQIRKEIAEKSRAEEEARMNDPEEQRKIEEEEERQKERLERERKEFEERERKFLEELEMKKKVQVEEEQMNAVQTELKEGAEEASNEDDEWEYVEEGPPEIIWQGNEIIVKKNKVKVKKKDINQDTEKEDTNRPTSNPLPPQSDSYAAYKNAPITSADLLDTVAQQVPNFGTEQDKAHCPFHIKTGACRFGSRCNRVHYYPDKSTTLLIKNMYNGPGLAWEQDEGLEYTEEEVERSFEDFYDDVHTEFLKFGEIVNFKVCRNGSFHLRGNVYVHYRSLDSAVMAYNSVHSRYFAGKQVKCEFVSLTRWKVAICGEYMKSRLKTCSRGSACNFLHCFSNPGGDYEWADCDKPPPRYWVKKMIALFGYSDDIEQLSPKDCQHSSRNFTSDRDSYHYKRHQSVETDRQNGSSSRGHHEEDRFQNSRRKREDERSYKDETEYKNDADTVGDRLNDNTHKRHRHSSQSRSRHNSRESKSRDYYGRSRTPHGSSSDEDLYTEKRVKRRSRDRKKAAKSYDDDEESDDAKHEFGVHKSNSSRCHHRRSRRHNDDEDNDEADPQESKNEPLTKKPKKHNIKPTTDKDAERCSRHKEHRIRSHDSVHILDKNDTSDRWDPDSSPNEHARDYQISDDRKRRNERSSRETRSSSLEESKDRDDHDNRMREKRKRI